MGLKVGLPVAILTAILAGCFQPAYEVSYSVAVTNVGETMIHDVSVAFDQYVSLGGALGPGKTSVEINVRHPVPETAIVRWSVDGSTEIEEEVPVKAVVAADFKGRLDFRISGEDVELVATE